MPRNVGGTQTHRAIEEATNLLLSSPRPVPKIILIATDGSPDDSLSANIQFGIARSQDIIIYAIGIGNDISISTLQSWTDDNKVSVKM